MKESRCTNFDKVIGKADKKGKFNKLIKGKKQIERQFSLPDIGLKWTKCDENDPIGLIPLKDMD